MNYIAMINSFWDSATTNPLSTGQVSLYFALLHVCNRSNWTEWFQAPNQVLSVLTGMSRSGILKARNELKQRGLIDFRERGTKTTVYCITIANSKQVGTQDGVQNSNQNSMQDGVQNSSTLYKYKHKQKQNNKKDTNVSKEPTDPSKVKHKRGEYGHVLLTDQELEKLTGEYGTSLTTDAVRYLDEYVEMKGYKHKSSYLAIRKWVIDAAKRERRERGGCFGEDDKPDKSRAAGNYLEDAGEDFTGF